MTELNQQITATIDCLRDLQYASSTAWEKSEFRNADLLALSEKAGEVLNTLSQTVHGKDYARTTADHPTEIRQMRKDGIKKIQGIKHLRTITGMGLKEAKDNIDLVTEDAWTLIFYPRDQRPLDADEVDEFIRNMNDAGYEVR